MRLIVLVLMIALLPLRAFAGDVMATQMASMAIAIEKVAAGAHETGAKGHLDHQKQMLEAAKAQPDCHEQQAGAHGEGNAQGSSNRTAAPSTDHCSSCSACQACHTVALSPAPQGEVALFASPPLRQTSSAAFTSADAAPGQKPPIC